MTDPAGTSKSHRAVQGLAVLGAGAVLFLGARFLIDFFGSALPYAMPDRNTSALDSEEFIQFLSLVTDGTGRRSRISRLKNGAEFFPAYLQAIRRPRMPSIWNSTNFWKVELATKFLPL
jgi:cardiolipin synthase